MGKILHKRIILISLVIGILSIVLIVTGIIFFPEKESFLPISFILFMFSLLAILSSYAIMYSEIKMLRKLTKYSLIFYPLLAIALSIYLMNTEPDITPGFVFPLVILILFTVLALMHLFIFTDEKSLTAPILLIIFIVISIILKRYRLPFNGPILTITLIFYSIGSIMFGIRCLYIAGKNQYFKYLAFLGSCFISLSFTGLLFKMMHWQGANAIVGIINVLMGIGTVVVLLTLPSSGYIDWTSIHKRILQKILLPWVLIFALFIMSFLMPDIFSSIMSKRQPKSTNGFDMVDYPIENKNGVKPD